MCTRVENRDWTYKVIWKQIDYQDLTYKAK